MLDGVVTFQCVLTDMTTVPQIIYKMEHNKTKAKGYTLPYDTPHTQHMKRVKDITSSVGPAPTGCASSGEARLHVVFFHASCR